jgi:hypothetical protein
MSDHQFERQVQQKMDELKLRPSDSVWEGVERELNNDKRRRWGWWWVPTLLLLCGAGGMIIFQNTKHNSADAVAKLSQKQSQSQPKTNAELTVPAERETAASSQKSTSPNTGDADTNQASQNATAETNRTSTQAHQKTLREKSILPAGITENGKSQGAETVSDGNTSKRYAQKHVKKSNRISSEENEIFVEEEPTLVGKTLRSSGAYKPQRLDVEEALRRSTTIVNAAPPSTRMGDVMTREKLWGFGLNAYVGVSNLNEGERFDNAQTTALMYPSFSGSPLPNGLMYRPSAIKKGPAFTLGAFAQRRFSKRFSMTVGLDYSEFSTYTEVGAQTNIVANQRSMLYLNSFYSPGSTERYHTRYQFVDLPITAQYQLNKNDRLPISVNAGVAVSRLLTTNALHYDSFTGGYYHDNNVFNRTHFMVAGGMSIGVLNNTHLPLTIGPLFKYQVTNLLKNDVPEGKHLLSAGLSVRMMWRKVL